ncbi:RNA-binding domain-containing protein, partial [Backusella circina FSU 941]
EYGGYSQQSSGYDRQDKQSHGSRFSSNESGMHRIEDTVYISNLPQDVTEEKLAAHFGSIGIIKMDKKTRKPKVWIYMDKTTNLPKGDATLTYDDPPSADAAIDWFGGKEFMGNVIEVSKAERKMSFPERGSGGFDRRGGGRGGGGGGYRDGGRGGSGGGGSGRPRESREGDWTCDGCGANNFSRRGECFKCHAQRPGGSGGGGGGGNDGRRGGSSSNTGRSGYRDGGDRSDRRDRYDDRRSSDRGSSRHGGGSRGEDGSYRKDRHERRDRPY